MGGTASGDAVWFYLGKLLWPHPLSSNYPRWQIDAGQWVSYLPLLAVIVILSIFRLRTRALVARLFFCLASIGPLALAGTALVRLSDSIIPKKPWLQSALCAAKINPNYAEDHNNLGNALVQRESSMTLWPTMRRP
jgi:hypothetical protein